MSIDQREQLRVISSAFMKVLLGLSGGLLCLLYYIQRDEDKIIRQDFKDAVKEISADVKDIKTSINIIDKRVDRLEYKEERR